MADGRGCHRRSESPSATRVIEAQVPADGRRAALLACVAARAEGETVITGAGELRVKESDRIAAVVANLQAIGATAEELRTACASSGRTARWLASQNLWRSSIGHGVWVLGAASGNAIEIDDRDCVAVSYPGFWADLAASHSA